MFNLMEDRLGVELLNNKIFKLRKGKYDIPLFFSSALSFSLTPSLHIVTILHPFLSASYAKAEMKNELQFNGTISLPHPFFIASGG